mmetsp:Transcript_15579/g.26803  ORF Transcript_15579/g.26803 Transcript_15579/m.26803 type:complete len:208 (+) Transcript_15579:17-640(+)
MHPLGRFVLSVKGCRGKQRATDSKVGDRDEAVARRGVPTETPRKHARVGGARLHLPAPRIASKVFVRADLSCVWQPMATPAAHVSSARGWNESLQRAGVSADGLICIWNCGRVEVFVGMAATPLGSTRHCIAIFVARQYQRHSETEEARGGDIRAGEKNKNTTRVTAVQLRLRLRVHGGWAKRPPAAPTMASPAQTSRTKKWRDFFV